MVGRVPFPCAPQHRMERQGPLHCALLHNAEGWVPSPVHHSTRRRDTLPSPVHRSTARRLRSPSPLYHSIKRRDGFLPLCTTAQDGGIGSLPLCTTTQGRGTRSAPQCTTGVSSALVLHGCYPLMCHAHEKVRWFYVDGVGCFSRDPPCTREARVDESGNPLPCIPCEALPRDSTPCKWMREERTADSGTVHWKLGFLKLAERAAGPRAEKRAAIRELRCVSNVCQTLVQKCDAHKALILAGG